MAVVRKLLTTALVRTELCHRSQKVQFSSFPQFSRKTRRICYSTSFTLIGVAGVAYVLKQRGITGKQISQSAKHLWNRNEVPSTTDHASIPRKSKMYEESSTENVSLTIREAQKLTKEEALEKGLSEFSDSICWAVILEDKEMWTNYKKELSDCFDSICLAAILEDKEMCTNYKKELSECSDSMCLATMLEGKEMWTIYKKVFNKSYIDSEDEKRRNIFQHSVLRIILHNIEYTNGIHSFKIGLNHFSDWTHIEYLRILNGYLEDT